MGRGSSEQLDADLNLIAVRRGDMRGTAFETLGTVELDDQQWSALKALIDLTQRHPDDAGFVPEEIRLTAADLLVSRAGQLDPTTLEDLLSDMEASGLIERVDDGDEKVAEGEPAKIEPSWKPSRAGVQLYGAFISVDWDQAAIGD